MSIRKRFRIQMIGYKQMFGRTLLFDITYFYILSKIIILYEGIYFVVSTVWLKQQLLFEQNKIVRFRRQMCFKILFLVFLLQSSFYLNKKTFLFVFQMELKTFNKNIKKTSTRKMMKTENSNMMEKRKKSRKGNGLFAEFSQCLSQENKCRKMLENYLFNPCLNRSFFLIHLF